MIYLATASGPAVREAIAAGHLGQMVTPAAGNRLVRGATWALDNGCFSDSWSQGRWLVELRRHANRSACLFAVVPDVVADADATDVLWWAWSYPVKSYGYPAAYVAQNGCQVIPDNADVLFIGGDTEWKLGAQARRIVGQAHQRDMWVHMGRVNSRSRLRYAADIGCHSVDGTLLAFGPDIRLPQLLGWLAPAQQALFGGIE